MIGLGSNLLVADEGYDGVAVRLEGALAAIEIDGSERALRRRRFAGRGRAPLHGGRAHRHRVRLRHPRHRRRGGAHERRRLRQRDPRRAELGRRRLGGRRAPRRPARARSELPAFQRARHRRSSPRPSSQLEHGARDEIRARVRDMQRRRSESQPRKARTFGSVFKNPDEGPGAGALIEACGLKGHVIGGASHLQRARQLHRERRQCAARPTSPRWSRSPGAACGSASRSIWSTKWSCSGPSPWPDPTHLGGRRRSRGAETGRVQHSYSCAVAPPQWWRRP